MVFEVLRLIRATIKIMVSESGRSIVIGNSGILGVGDGETVGVEVAVGLTVGAAVLMVGATVGFEVGAVVGLGIGVGVGVGWTTLTETTFEIDEFDVASPGQTALNIQVPG